MYVYIPSWKSSPQNLNSLVSLYFMTCLSIPFRLSVVSALESVKVVTLSPASSPPGASGSTALERTTSSTVSVPLQENWNTPLWWERTLLQWTSGVSLNVHSYNFLSPLSKGSREGCDRDRSPSSPELDCHVWGRQPTQTLETIATTFTMTLYACTPCPVLCM